MQLKRDEEISLIELIEDMSPDQFNNLLFRATGSKSNVFAGEHSPIIVISLECVLWLRTNSHFAPRIIQQAIEKYPNHPSIPALRRAERRLSSSLDFIGADAQNHNSGSYEIVDKLAPPSASKQSLPNNSRDNVSRSISLTQAQSDLRIVSTYKNIHDLLHEIQRVCYDPLVVEVSLGDNFAFDAIELYLGTFVTYVSELEVIAQDPILPPGEMDWVEGRLKPAQILWDESIRVQDRNSMRKVIRSIKQIIVTYHSQVDQALYRAASRLIPEFVRLKHSHISVNPANLDDPEIISATSLLEASATELKELVRIHHDWQEIETENRRISECLQDMIAEIEISWPNIQRLTSRIIVRTEPWAPPMKTAYTSLEHAISGGEWTKISRSFNQFCRVSKDLFYVVDKNLKSKCEAFTKFAPATATTQGRFEP